MIWFLRRQNVRPAAICIGLLLSASACSAPAGLHSDGTAPAEQHQIPFQDDKTAKLAGGQDPASGGATSLPFHDAESLPVGTLLTVRLKDPISAENPDASGTFAAIVDEPVVVEGSAVVPRGASVAGRVESARSSKVKANRGYVRLTLDSIDLDGKDLAVQTSSLFARGIASDGKASGGVIKLERGRRLTFRLAEPVYVASRHPVPSH